MQFLIEWKESKEQEVHRFGVLNEGDIEPNAQQLEDEDDQIFYWLTTEEALAIGSDYDGGEWVVIRCACEECEEEQTKECVYCEGVANFEWLDGGWYVCTGCVKEGKTDTEGEGE